MLCYRPKKQQQLDITKLRYPLYVSPKLDGFRALISPGTDVLSRRLRKFPNRYVQKTFGLASLIGLDGELIAGEPTAPDAFLRSQTAVMSEDAIDKDLRFYVFDDFLSDRSFILRLGRLTLSEWPKNVEILEQTLAEGPHDVRVLFDRYCEAGYEGIILRNPNGLYKQGRSTLDEQYLLKYKPFHDSEAEIIGFEEMMHNDNVATRDARGKLKRSKAKDGLRPAGVLGRIKLRDVDTNQIFWAGSGQPFFTDDGRKKYWAIRKKLLKRIVKYRCQITGGKEAPRFPRTLAFRDKIDL